MDKERLMDEILKRVQQFMEEEKHITEEPDVCYIDFLESSSTGNNCESAEIRLKNLTIEAMVQIAMGQCDKPQTKIVRDAFLLGKNVYVKKEEIELFQYKQTAAITYYQMLKGYLDLLEKSGLIICTEYCDVRKKEHSYICEKDSEKKNQVFVSKNDGEVVKKKLLTEQDLIGYNIAGVSKLHVSNKTIITDLAKDYARQYRIEILRDNK